MEEKNKKLGFIIPYRNRREQLKEFTRRLQRYMEKFDITYKIYVINQDDAKLFNRGMLLNIGYTYAKKDKCDYLVFHDVDMLPVHVDYSYSDIPLHLATHFIIRDDKTNRTIFDEYFGGVTMFPIEMFEKINGFSNKYWGWGYEDTDLLLRCAKNSIPLENLRIKNMGKSSKSLKFNGVDAYVECKNIFNINNNISFFVSFYPDDVIYNHEKDVDDFNVFTIPGYDLAISYNSFSRYNFCIFDYDKNVLYVNSNIKTNYKTNIVVSIDHFNYLISVYQDGYLIDTLSFEKKFYNYNEEKNFYLGCGNPTRNNNLTKEYPKFFKGYITSFAAYDCVLSKNEVEEICLNESEDLRVNRGEYISAENLILYYDAEHIVEYELEDLTGYENNGIIHNCEIVDLSLMKNKIIKIPFRRESTFQLLPHIENGFSNNRWKHQATRWNQLRFNNEVRLDTTLIINDGINDLKFIEYGKLKINENISHINVGI